MKDIIPELEIKLKDFLQKNIKFSLESKTIKSGKLILFSVNYYSFIFTLKNKSKSITYKIPIPFDYSYNDGKLIFNYKITTFSKSNSNIESILSRISKKSYSKLYNKNLEILEISN